MMNEAQILLVDDEEHIRRGLGQLLELEDYSVTCAADGAEGWQMFQQMDFDLVITDIKMPRLDGLQLLRMAREHAPEVPVIIITGHGDLDMAIEALRGGAYDFITKPFDHDVVLAAVARALEKRRLGKELEAAHKLASLGTLAAGVAHELNTPLNVIIGAAERLLKHIGQDDVSPYDPETIRKYLDMIVRNGLRCARIVRALKTYARAEPLEREDCDLNAIVQDSLTLIEHTLQIESNVWVETDLAPDLPQLQADPNKLTQVFVNLLSNARDAMPDGGTITITTCKGDDDQTIVATVSDTGTGIPPDVLPRIFDPFFTTKPVGQGTGLGLSIVAGIVQDHQGTLHVESQPGQGTTFTLTLPVCPDAQAAIPVLPPTGRYDGGVERRH